MNVSIALRRRSRSARQLRAMPWGTTLAECGHMPGTPGSPGLACCAACGGFILDPAAACIHCDAAPPPRRRLARFLLTSVLGVAASVTLMACYGMTYECDGPNGSCVDVCYQDTDCQNGYYCDQG